MSGARWVLALAVLATALGSPAGAGAQQVVACPAQQDSLLVMPQISSSGGRLRATLRLVDGQRTMWGADGDPRCAMQNMRYLTGSNPSGGPVWPVSREPMPGPTFRARLGDLVQISFFNQINTANFANTLDRGDAGTTPACDQYTTTSATGSRTAPAGGDSMPNCLHGSSTTNVHFHGTHTTPETTGDNILLFIRPAMRTNGKLRPIDELRARVAFDSVFQRCNTQGPPTSWSQIPGSWQVAQRNLLKEYDRTAPYQGVIGALPVSSRLWPADSSAIAGGWWPQYQIGAYPYCFPLPRYDSTRMAMGQSPGTHWYHAHKHGSTALNVANALTGALIITGPYDETLRAYYGPGFREQVLMLQQLGSAPFPLTNPNATFPGSVGRPPMSVNGRRNPVVGMRPGEVQLWRIINGAFRDAVQLSYIEPQTATPCRTGVPPATVQWRQIAQDGVQFNVRSYGTQGAINRKTNMAPANRADFLVLAPPRTGLYTLCAVRNSGLFVQGTTGAPDSAQALFTISVGGSPVSPAQQFIPESRFPVQPSFLRDIPAESIFTRRDVVFGAGNSTINGRAFADHRVDQAMLLNSAEEWTVKNEANDKSHPFHIHINPFQITEIFEPNSPAAKDSTNACYVNPNDPATFKPCPAAQPRAPFIWWDVFAIPTGQQIDITARCRNPNNPADSARVAFCPAPLRPYTRCSAGKCTEYIPGWFRMRSRFVDFTGQYVLHCHILIHEDRGMMQLIEVVSDQSGYSHH